MADAEISQEILDRYRQVDLASVWSGVGRNVRGPSVMQNVRTNVPGTRLVARARTLRYMPTRRFIRPGGPANPEVARNDLPEYRAISRCGPGDVLVMDCMTKTIVPHIGDVKAFGLKQNGAEGMVSDGSVRDLTAVLALGLKVFSAGNGIAAGTDETDQYEENVVVGCGGVLVRPGDLIVGDDGGVIVVPQEIVIDVLEFAEDHTGAEEYVKELAERENVPPWTYYPPNDEFIARYKREKLGHA